MVLRTAALVALAALTAVLSPAQPKFTVEGGMSVDFGELYVAAPVERELRISNGGTDTLRISNVSGSCGCTGTLLSSGEIPPGGDATLKITFDPAKFSGKVEKVVSMKTNDPAAANPHITFSATVTHILGFDQTHLVFSTRPDSAATTVVSIRNLTDGPVRITGVKSSSEELLLGLTDNTLDPGQDAALNCTITPAKPGILRGEVTLTTDHPLLPSVSLRFFSYARPPKAARPDSPGR